MLHEVYALTTRGKDELQAAMTTLSATELEILIRLDGTLTLAQIQQAMPAMAPDVFVAKIQDLRDRRLTEEVVKDFFESQLQAQLNKLTLSVVAAEADSGLLSLRKAGYFVEIARQPLPVRARGSNEGLNVLVVEDEPILAKFIQAYLAFEGLQVRLAGNRAEVIAELRKLPVPDLVLLDVMLPDADGFDILLRMRQHPVLKNVSIIMLTGKATREAVIKGIAGGADGYVTKPFEAESLMRAVRTVLGLPEPHPLPGSADTWSREMSRS